MIPHREEHLDLCAAYALGNLEPAARAELEAHLESGCAECEAALADFSSAAAMVAAGAPPVAVPAGFKDRVLNLMHASPQESPARTATDGVGRDVAPRSERSRVLAMPPRRAWGLGEWALAAAAVILAITTATTWKSAQTLQLEIDQRQRQIADLSQQLADEKRWTSVLAAPNAEAASFALTPAGAKELKARAIYDPGTRRAVIVFDNFGAPSGRDYQLWALRGQGVASLGLIKADENGHAVLRLENVGDPKELAGFAVSLEPVGGSPNPTAPTGPVVMAAKFGG